MDLEQLKNWVQRIEARVIWVENDAKNRPIVLDYHSQVIDIQQELIRLKEKLAAYDLVFKGLNDRIAAGDRSHASLVNDVKNLVTSKPKQWWKF